jgi:tRNA threonylcarbamoyladenosine modification (KEOPS) complex  Pcc1 subunit
MIINRSWNMVFGELRVSADFKDPDVAWVVLEALKPELKVSRRFRVSAARRGGRVILKVVAKDYTALRVAANFYLRHLTCVRNVLNTLKPSIREGEMC